MRVGQFRGTVRENREGASFMVITAVMKSVIAPPVGMIIACC